jgi:hypothetical protein
MEAIMTSRVVLMLASALLLSFASTPSHALTFNFSFDNLNGNVSGTVTGQIFGLNDNATGPATAVDITSAPPGLVPLPLPLSMPVSGSENSNNTFTVNSGVITASGFDGVVLDGTTKIELILTSGPSLVGSASLGVTSPPTANGVGSTIQATYTEVPTTTTPLPATLPLFATGLGALGLLGWRRKRKARVSLLGAA